MKTGVILTLVLLITISPLHDARVSNHDIDTVDYVWQKWRGLVEQQCLDLDPALVMAIIAQESRGNPKAVRDEGHYQSVGLMQIMDFDWRPPASWLLKPENNIQWGCGILRQLFAREGYTVEKVLAVYNCGEVGVKANRCGSMGGYAYADRILNHWKPLFDRKYNLIRLLRLMILRSMLYKHNIMSY
jgi:soluble lytic murein transglycosylase-like protein